jgi:tRNA (cytidine/uridine-2'-O-)-methyltransferase
MNVVLIEPEIPWNTGNIGRTCVGVGATLHLVGQLGFKIDSKEIRRSGLDYWPKLSLRLHPDVDAFLDHAGPGAELVLFTAQAPRPFWDAPLGPDAWLVFGKESTGLPKALLERFADRIYRIPIREEARSLNLSTAAGVAIYETVRRLHENHHDHIQSRT